MGLLKRWTKNKVDARANINTARKLMKDSGYNRPKDFHYIDTKDTITIDFKGNNELKNRVLKTLDSSIEWGLRLNK